MKYFLVIYNRYQIVQFAEAYIVVVQILIPGKRKSAGEICTLALRMDGAGTKQRHLQPARVSFVQQKSNQTLGPFQ